MPDNAEDRRSEIGDNPRQWRRFKAKSAAADALRFFDGITGIPLADGLYLRSGIRAMLTDLLTIALAL